MPTVAPSPAQPPSLPRMGAISQLKSTIVRITTAVAVFFAKMAASLLPSNHSIRLRLIQFVVTSDTPVRNTFLTDEIKNPYFQRLFNLNPETEELDISARRLVSTLKVGEQAKFTNKLKTLSLENQKKFALQALRLFVPETPIGWDRLLYLLIESNLDRLSTLIDLTLPLLSIAKFAIPPVMICLLRIDQTKKITEELISQIQQLTPQGTDGNTIVTVINALANLTDNKTQYITQYIHQVLSAVMDPTAPAEICGIIKAFEGKNATERAKFGNQLHRLPLVSMESGTRCSVFLVAREIPIDNLGRFLDLVLPLLEKSSQKDENNWTNGTNQLIMRALSQVPIKELEELIPASTPLLAYAKVGEWSLILREIVAMPNKEKLGDILRKAIEILEKKQLDPPFEQLDPPFARTYIFDAIRKALVLS